MAYSILDFKPDTNLVNPQFEGYKLHLPHANRSGNGWPRIYPLAFDSVVPRQLASSTLLAYDEVYHRVHYNHLLIGPTDGTLIYIDKSSAVNLVHIDTEGPRTMRIFTVPTPDEAASSAMAGYPGAYSLSENVVLVFDGCETMYVLQQQLANDHSGSRWVPVGSFAVGPGPLVAGASEHTRETARRHYFILGAQLVAKAGARTVHLHICHRINTSGSRKGSKDTGTSIVPSAAHSSSHMDAASSNSTNHSTTYCIQALQVDLPQTTTRGPGDVTQDSCIPLLLSTTVHTLHSHAIPLYCEYLPGGGRYMMGVRDGVVIDDTELASRPQSRTGLAPVPAPSLQAQYYWMQTPTDVTVCIQLPVPISARQITCSLTRTSLNLQFADAPECDSFSLPLSNTRFYDQILADESVWTLESGKLLTLYLQKANEGVRWPTVFERDDGVLETMDPNEFAVIREQLEKFTSENIQMHGAAMPRLHPAGDAVDQDSGDIVEQEDLSVVFSVRDWQTGQVMATSVAGSPDWLCASLPRPLSRVNHLNEAPVPSEASSVLPPVCLSFDVDGVVFGFSATEGGGNQCLEVHARHMGTFSALSYIQASKREKRLMYVDAEMRLAVLAESQRRVFIYRQVLQSSDAFAEQNVVDLGGDGDDEILGLQLANDTLAILREHTVCLVDVSRGIL
ncbi:hypothetical protein GQ54DRAFT_298532 [Martensiomyces pterosporus]|nr:hypothetical protein GQ54DRAFT_298532 [Martensiomyces pterosporus]